MDIPTRRQQFKALVQAQSTVISALPYLLGCAFTYFYYDHFNIGDAARLFIAVICFHLAVNGHNQYTDYRRSMPAAQFRRITLLPNLKSAFLGPD